MPEAAAEAASLPEAELHERFVARQVEHQLGEWLDREAIELDLADVAERQIWRGPGFTIWDARHNRIVWAKSEGGVVFDGTRWARNPQHANPKMVRLAVALNTLRPHARDGVYCFDLEDSRQVHEPAGKPPFPVFQYHRRPYSRTAILWRNALYHDLDYPGFLGGQQVDEPGFRRKKPKVAWRGTLSGSAIVHGRRHSTLDILGLHEAGTIDADTMVDDLRRVARFRVCEQAVGHEVLDVGLVPNEPLLPVADHAAIRPVLKERMPMDEWLRHRYLLCMEGYDYGTSLYWCLNSHSVVLRQQYCWETYADVHLKPWVHYVPVGPDAADIAATVQWCEQRLDMCEQISANARAVCRLLAQPALREQAFSRVVGQYETRFRRDSVAALLDGGPA